MIGFIRRHVNAVSNYMSYHISEILNAVIVGLVCVFGTYSNIICLDHQEHFRLPRHLRKSAGTFQAEGSDLVTFRDAADARLVRRSLSHVFH